MTRQHPITAVFWHRSRRAFTPMTVADIVRRTKADPRDIARQLKLAFNDGFVTSQQVGQTGTTVYDITDAGRAAVMAGMVQ